MMGDSIDQTHLASVAAALADALAVPPPQPAHADHTPSSPRWDGQSLSSGHLGVTLLHALRARDGSAGWERPARWFAAAVREPIAAAGGAGLWHGAPALAFTLRAARLPGSEPLLAHLDAVVAAMVTRQIEAAERRIAARQRPEPGEYDLVRGLTGLGVHLLTGDPASPHLRAVLSYLVDLTVPVPADDEPSSDVPGWWTRYIPHGKTARDYGEGHSDNGMAHGITGPLAFLALAHRAGITVPGQRAAITAIWSWLERWQQFGTAGPWWPERVTFGEYSTGHVHQTGPARPSWCYGTPGITRSLQLGARVLNDRSRQVFAEHALLACVSDPVQMGWLNDPALCHGWAGTLATVAATAADATTADLTEQLPRLTEHLLHALDTTPRQRPGLLDGTAGPALVLHSLSTGGLTDWTNSLLITGGVAP
ncbi:lanthionine synthetase C family protein [Actinomadura flavalba]|uniref:lanthionine synthetase C family protein n=1 Tax=Actinomadura flavalba TaxID=1120938 RepID=UPI00036D973B|nr:lanthionine synthetase C family protein [Actinomadura flavalba]